jgi:ribonuclease P protein component
MSVKFGPTVRLRSRSEFDLVQQHGRRVAARYLTLLGRPNTLPHDRIGIIASRRLGNAVARTRAKRRVRELFRRQEPDAARHLGRRPMDLVAIPRRELVAAPFADVEADFGAAVARLRGRS